MDDAILALQSSNYILEMSILAHSYSILKMAERKFIGIERKEQLSFNYGESTKLYEAGVSYYLLCMPCNESFECPICLDTAEGNTEVYFHDKHAFHKKCLTGWINEASANLFSNMRLSTNTYTHRGTTVQDHSVEILKENIPSCPSCRDRPSHHPVEVTIDQRGATVMTVNQLGQLSLWQKTYRWWGLSSGQIFASIFL